MPNPDEISFQFLAENSVDTICRVGLDHIVRYASPSSTRLLGWKPEELVGTGPDALVLPEDLPVLIAAANRIYSPEVDNSPATVRMRRKDGAVIWVEINARLVRDSSTGEPLETVLVMRDITERKLFEEKLLAEALTDSLTGLANRRAFDESLGKEWKRTVREGSQMSLLLLDIDHFKRFNDQYGHQSGDDCLRTVAIAVRDAARREIDIVTRYGGEEIAIILPCTDAAGAMMVAESVRLSILALQIPHPGNAQGGGLVTVSIGVATALARHGGTMRMPESLLMSADSALYKAKHEGRNRISTTLVMTSQDV
jgi:diguanylate cyclase (GGDEF)-like protein/PAS domain S-box-containing protein